MASSDRISRPYHVESWSSQTWLDFAMSTRRGIHASSLEKRSGSSPRAEKSLMSGRPPGIAEAAAEPLVEPPLLLADHVHCHQELPQQPREPVAEERPPAFADPAQLSRERRRVGPGGRPQELDEREPLIPQDGSIGRERLQRGDGAIASVRCHPAVVDQLAQRAQGRVLVGHAQEQQLLEAFRQVAGVELRELRCDRPEQRVVGPVADRAADRAAGRVHLEPGILLRRGVHDEMEDLVEERQRGELTRLDRGRTGRMRRVDAGRDPARQGDGCGRGRGRAGGLEPVAEDGLPGERQLHHRSVARRPGHQATVRGRRPCGSVLITGSAMPLMARSRRRRRYVSRASRMPRSGIGSQSGRALSS